MYCEKTVEYHADGSVKRITVRRSWLAAFVAWVDELLRKPR